MAQQWIRSCSLTVGGITLCSDADGVRVRFTIESAASQTTNSGEFTISNLKPSTAKSLLALAEKSGQEIELNAGYQSNAGLIFKGAIIQVRIGRENPTDTVVIINATMGDIAYNHGVVNKALAKGHTPKDIFSALVASMNEHGVQEGYAPEFFKNLKYPRGATFFGMARDYLRTLAHSHGCLWSIQNGKLDMVPINGALPGGTVVLNAETGMIGLPVQTQNAIEVKALINPDIKINGTIKLNNDSIQQSAFATSITDPTGAVSKPLMPSLPSDGIYKVLKAKWEGDTRGQPWYVTVTCLGLNSSLSATQGTIDLLNSAANAGLKYDYQTGTPGGTVNPYNGDNTPNKLNTNG